MLLVDELQGDPEFIAKRKVKLAAKYCDTPVIIEDVSLCFNAYKGLPGPYM
jgi:inosine triphosphate pyrophosphatase